MSGADPFRSMAGNKWISGALHVGPLRMLVRIIDRSEVEFAAPLAHMRIIDYVYS